MPFRILARHMRKKRDSNIFSLSFLDCICCGFGAIVLLFVISMGVQTRKIDSMRDILVSMISQRQLKLNEYQIETEIISTQLALEQTELSKKREDIEEFDSLIAILKQQILDKQSSLDKFLVDNEQLKKEIAALQKDIDIEQKVVEFTPVGVPVESTHIALVIDTSGSMRDQNTNLIRGSVVAKFAQILDSYPDVKGIQLLDSDGYFIVGRRSSNGWIKDSQATRADMLRRLRFYGRESSSNPVPGIERAIRVLGDAGGEDMKMGIYVFGDEFTGKSSDSVLKRFEKLNEGKDGERIARINALGFPNVVRQGFTLGLNQSGLKFANLMRELTYAHGGAFIALEGGALDQMDRIDREQNPVPVVQPRRPVIIGPGGVIFGP